MRHQIPMMLKVVISIGLIALIIWSTDLSGALAAMSQVRVSMFGCALLIMLVNMLSRAYKWQLLLEVQDVRVPLLRILNLMWMSMFFNNFTPGTLGGDVFRVYKVRGQSSTGGVVSSVVFERATGFFMAIVLALVSGLALLLAADSLVSIQSLAVLILLAVVVGSCSFLAVMVLVKNTQALLQKRLPKVARALEEFSASLLLYRRHGKIVAIALLLSLVFYILKSLTIYFFVLSVNATASFAVFLFFAPLLGLLVMIPISLNGIGIQEGSYILYLERLGLEDSAALLVAVIARIAVLILGLIGGLLFLVQSGSRSKESGLTG